MADQPRRRKSHRVPKHRKHTTGRRVGIPYSFGSRCLKSIVLLVALAGGARAHAEETAKVKAAVERALPFLEKEGVAWMKEKACASCHHVPFLLWIHHLARDGGIRIDEAKRAEWTDWTLKFSKSKREWFKLTSESLAKERDKTTPAMLAKLKPVVGKPFADERELRAELSRFLTREELERNEAALVANAARPLEPGVNDGGGLDTVVQLLLGRDRTTMDANRAAFTAELEEIVLRWQRPDGSWKAAGQLPSQNRSASESDAATTAWAVLAMASVERPVAQTNDAIRRAVAFLRTTKPGVSTESLAATMLVERKLGRPERSAELLKELLARQNKDGGWAWRQGGGSDAFATGQALYILVEAGVRIDNPSVGRAQHYLTNSQQADGTWPVTGRGISIATNEPRLAKLEPIYRYWGTAWAAIGLADTLPQVRKQ
jgi:hypothetical protein